MKGTLLALLLVSGTASSATSDFVAVVDASRLADMDTAALHIDLAQLGYPTVQSIPGARVDLNADGIAELLLRGGPTYCGTGGCTFFLFDGRDGSPLGMVFGSTLIVQATRIGGWSALAAFSRGGATSGTYATFVHDGTQYTRVTAVELRTESVTDLLNSLRAVDSPGTSP